MLQCSSFPFFNSVMKGLKGLLSFFITLFFVSCQTKVDENGVVDSNVESIDTIREEKQDSLCGSIVQSLSKDSVCFRLSFRDINGSSIPTQIPFGFCLDGGFESQQTDANGLFDTIVAIHDLIIATRNDSFYYSLDEYAGDTMNEGISLPVRVVRGRVMEEDGTPLRQMPIHVHSFFKTDKRKIVDDLFENDLLTYTDSMGYYCTYVPENVFKVSLRTCGFLLGNITRHELLNYPRQNFLYMPFSIRNICADDAPMFLFSVTDQDLDITISADNWDEFFKYDEVFENSQRVVLTAVYGRSRLSKKITKKNGLFRNPSFTICLHRW